VTAGKNPQAFGILAGERSVLLYGDGKNTCFWDISGEDLVYYTGIVNIIWGFFCFFKNEIIPG